MFGFSSSLKVSRGTLCLVSEVVWKNLKTFCAWFLMWFERILRVFFEVFWKNLGPHFDFWSSLKESLEPFLFGFWSSFEISWFLKWFEIIWRIIFVCFWIRLKESRGTDCAWFQNYVVWKKSPRLLVPGFWRAVKESYGLILSGFWGSFKESCGLIVFFLK